MKTKTTRLMMGLMIFILNSVQANIAGHWEGELKGDDDQPFQVTLDLDKNEASEWIASMGIPEENMTGLVVQDVTVEGKTVEFVAVELMMTPFNLKLGPEGTLKGTTSGRAPQSVELRRTGEAKIKLITASPAVSEQLEGDWEGMLQTPRCGVPMAFHFKNQPDGTVKATMGTDRDKNLPLNDVKQTGQKVEFGMKIAHSRFEGTLNEEGTELTGQMIHGDNEHFSPMTLRKKQ
ncbi:hypothetical protein P4B35_10300 [Pontiellaceae bacterium B12227]|nr:hypothetical protein [Pontiellaceae bacterium B12227]